MLKGFHQALFPGDHVVLGLRLERMTLGHLRLIMQCRGHWFAEVYACSQPWRIADKDAGKWWFAWWWKLWQARIKKLDHKKEIERWEAYIDEQWSAPLSKTPLQPGQIMSRKRRIASPDIFALEATARAELGMGDECMDRPVNELLALIAAHRELTGEIELWTEDDEAAWQFVQRLQNNQRN